MSWEVVSAKVNSVWVINQLKKLIENGFWGKTVIYFENGVVQRLVKEESIQPPDKPPKGVAYRTNVKS